MRHRNGNKKLGRSTAHHRALMASLVCALIKEKRIKTTVAKAKLAKSMADKMVTLGKNGTLAARRQALAKLRDEDSVVVLFDEIAPSFEGRNGGYTRVLKLGQRSSDGSEMALLEWVENSVVTVAEPAAAVTE